MNSLRYAACILALGLVPRPGPSTNARMPRARCRFRTSKEGAFGETWRRKQYLQSQGIPQARAALERNQRECAAAPAEAVAHAGPLRRGNLPQGSQFVQEQEAASAKDKAACEARSEELRQQLKALEKELEGL